MQDANCKAAEKIAALRRACNYHQVTRCLYCLLEKAHKLQAAFHAHSMTWDNSHLHPMCRTKFIINGSSRRVKHDFNVHQTIQVPFSSHPCDQLLAGDRTGGLVWKRCRQASVRSLCDAGVPAKRRKPIPEGCSFDAVQALDLAGAYFSVYPRGTRHSLHSIKDIQEVKDMGSNN